MQKLSASARGYDVVWRRLRAAHLAANPFCVYCKRDGKLTAAQVVDHIKKFKDAPALRLAPDNLQSLCKRCHDSTKQREERSRVHAIGADGWPL